MSSTPTGRRMGYGEAADRLSSRGLAFVYEVTRNSESPVRGETRHV